MARDFIIQQQKEAVQFSVVPEFEGLIPTYTLDGSTSLMVNFFYSFNADELPFIMSLNGPVTLRGTTQPYYLTTVKED